MVKPIIIFCLFLLACRQDNNIPATQISFKDKVWRPYEYSRNGILDPSLIAMEQRYEFRSDNRLYFSQANPARRDTFLYSVLDSANIRITRPWLDPNYYANARIDLLTENNFNFTMTNNQETNVHQLKTQKQ